MVSGIVKIVDDGVHNIGSVPERAQVVHWEYYMDGRWRRKEWLTERLVWV